LPKILRHAPCLILLTAILAALPAGASPQSEARSTSQQPLSLSEYISELDRCSAILANPVQEPASLRSLRLSLPPKWTVKSGDEVYGVSTDWLADGLAAIENDPRTSNPALSRTLHTLQAYREAAEAIETPVPSQDLAESRARLNEILGAKEFRGAQGPSWFDVIKARMWAWINRHLEKLFGKIGLSQKISNVVAWTLITFAALLLVFWMVRYLMRTGPRAEMDLHGASALGRDWHYWLREARAAAGRGDYRSAIHAAYWTAIAQLEETSSLPQDRSRTPRESLRLTRKESVTYAPLSQLTRRFELVWYGYRSASAADWSDATQQLEALGCQRSSTPAISGS
jgi:hypothetical protein